MRPYWPGSSSSRVVTVAAAPEAAWRSASAVTKPASSSGWSPESTITSLEPRERLARAQDRVARAGGRILDRDLDAGRQHAPHVLALAAEHHDDRSAPASRAASTGHSSSGRPQSGCSTFGSCERMRVPRPAAMISTEGIFTAP